MRLRGRLPAVLALTGALVIGAAVPSTAAVHRSARERAATTRPAAATPVIGDRAPSFTLRTLDGGRFSLSRLSGRPVLVNFWASWCHPCRQEFPLLEKARARHRAEGFEIVGVTYRDITSDARSFVRSRHADWKLVVDGSGSVAKDYGVASVPQSFLVRPDGTIAARQFGGYRSAKALEADLAAILGP
jgi:cytochrome c biogenesis protein CcmG, thiol:disulfide interchange protein DsbE